MSEPDASPPSGPEVDVVRAHIEALRTGDLAALRRTVSAQLLEQVDAPDFEAKLSLLRQLAPAAFSVVAVSTEGERATVELSTELQVGLFRLVNEEGSWRVAGQSWRGLPADAG